MHPFHVLLMLFAVLSLVAFAFLLRWERRYFLQLGKVSGWLPVRIATLPIALITAALVIIPARSTSGMEGLAVFYALLFTLAPAFWFGAHWLAGKLVRPSLSLGESARIAVSPLALGFVLVMVAHALQSFAWSLLRSMGLV